MIQLYGIPNCDTVKKAKNYLTDQEVEFEFVNFKKTPPKKSDLLRWKKAFGDYPVNKRGRTYKLLQDEFEAANAEGKYELMIQNTSLIKRPILQKGSGSQNIIFGFAVDTYAAAI